MLGSLFLVLSPTTCCIRDSNIERNLLVHTYAALLNLRVIIPSNKTQFVAVDQTYWRVSMAHQIASIYIDEVWYMQRYPDVAKAVLESVVVSARQQYCQSGYYEHRMPYLIEVHGDWYMSEYADVKEAVEKEVFKSPQDHFERIGFREGRYPFPEFALRPQSEVLTTDAQSSSETV